MIDVDPTAIGARIREVRGQSTQQELASLLGVGRVSVARYETGERTPDAVFIARFSVAFDVHPLWLLLGRDGGGRQRKPLEAAELVLIDNYRRADEAGQRVIESTAALAASGSKATTLSHLPKPRSKITIHGDVGQQIKGDVHNAGPMTITVGGRSNKGKR